MIISSFDAGDSYMHIYIFNISTHVSIGIMQRLRQLVKHVRKIVPLSPATTPPIRVTGKAWNVCTKQIIPGHSVLIVSTPIFKMTVLNMTQLFAQVTLFFSFFPLSVLLARKVVCAF